MTWGQVIAQYQAEVKDSVVTLKYLSQIVDCRTELPNILDEVGKDLYFHLLNDFCWINGSKSVKNIVN